VRGELVVLASPDEEAGVSIAIQGGLIGGKHHERDFRGVPLGEGPLGEEADEFTCKPTASPVGIDDDVAQPEAIRFTAHGVEFGVAAGRFFGRVEEQVRGAILVVPFEELSFGEGRLGARCKPEQVLVVPDPGDDGGGVAEVEWAYFEAHAAQFSGREGGMERGVGSMFVRWGQRRLVP